MTGPVASERALRLLLRAVWIGYMTAGAIFLAGIVVGFGLGTGWEWLK